MTQITPAILVENYENLKKELIKYVNVSQLVQIDMCDGNFVPSVSWPMHLEDKQSIVNILNEEEGLPFWDKLDFEFDLMVREAHKQIDFFIRLGAKQLVFHLEAEGDLVLFKEFIEGLDLHLRENIKIGIAINTTTPIKSLESFISHIDFVQCMGIKKIGFQGQDFDERILDQVSKIRQKYEELEISVDGGVNKDTAKKLIEAGATRLVIGSALKKDPNIIENIKYFESL